MDNNYHKKYNLTRYYRLREWMFSVIGKKCALCGKEATEIDHIDPKTKSFNLSTGFAFAKVRIEKELKKCQPLCYMCHNAKTIIDCGKKKAIGTHGTVSSYRYCKCELCRKAHSNYTKEYRKTHPRKKYAGIP